MANRPRSHMIQRRFNRSATAPVVPLPQKKSATSAPSCEDDWMMRLIKASGFCVSYPVRSSAAVAYPRS